MARVTREHGRHVPLAMRFSLQGEGWEQEKKSTQPTGSCHNRSSWFRVFKGSHQLPKKAWGLKAGGFPAFMSTLGCSVAIIRLCRPPRLVLNPRNTVRIPNQSQPRIISQSQGWQCFLCLVSARDKSTQGCRCRFCFCVVCWGLAWGLVGPLILQPATNRSSAPPTPGSCREKREDQGLELRGPFADLGSDQSVEWEMANAAWQKARDAPWDYGSWAELLTLLEGQGDASQLKLAYEEVLLEFPFSADTW